MTRVYDRPTLLGSPPSPSIIGAEAGRLAAALRAMTPLLDGTNTMERVCGDLAASGIDPTEIVQAFTWLEERGLVGDAPDSDAALLTPEESSQYAAQRRVLASLTGRAAQMSADDPRMGASEQAALKRSTVVQFGLGALGASVLRSLALAGVGRVVASRCSPSEVLHPLSRDIEDSCRTLAPSCRVDVLSTPDDVPASLADVAPAVLVYTPDRDSAEFRSWLNDVSIQVGVPLLVVRPEPLGVEIGPTVFPRETACLTCLDLRRQATGAQQHEAETGSIDCALRFPLGAEAAAIEVVRVLIGAEPVTRGRLWRMDLSSGRTTLHSVLRLPRCPSCGVHRVRPARKLWEAE